MCSLYERRIIKLLIFSKKFLFKSIMYIAVFKYLFSKGCLSKASAKERKTITCKHDENIGQDSFKSSFLSIPITVAIMLTVLIAS